MLSFSHYLLRLTARSNSKDTLVAPPKEYVLSESHVNGTPTLFFLVNFYTELRILYLISILNCDAFGIKFLGILFDTLPQFRFTTRNYLKVLNVIKQIFGILFNYDWVEIIRYKEKRKFTLFPHYPPFVFKGSKEEKAFITISKDCTSSLLSVKI